MTLPEARDQQAKVYQEKRWDNGSFADQIPPFISGWDACLKELTKRIGEFDDKACGDEAVLVLKDLPKSWSDTDKFGHSCGVGHGARWQHAEILKLLRGES